MFDEIIIWIHALIIYMYLYMYQLYKYESLEIKHLNLLSILIINIYIFNKCTYIRNIMLLQLKNYLKKTTKQIASKL